MTPAGTVQLEAPPAVYGVPLTQAVPKRWARPAGGRQGIAHATRSVAQREGEEYPFGLCGVPLEADEIRRVRRGRCREARNRRAELDRAIERHSPAPRGVLDQSEFSSRASVDGAGTATVIVVLDVSETTASELAAGVTVVVELLADTENVEGPATATMLPPMLTIVDPSGLAVPQLVLPRLPAVVQIAHSPGVPCPVGTSNPLINMLVLAIIVGPTMFAAELTPEQFVWEQQIGAVECQQLRIGGIAGVPPINSGSRRLSKADRAAGKSAVEEIEAIGVAAKRLEEGWRGPEVQFFVIGVEAAIDDAARIKRLIRTSRRATGSEWRPCS